MCCIGFTDDTVIRFNGITTVDNYSRLFCYKGLNLDRVLVITKSGFVDERNFKATREPVMFKFIEASKEYNIAESKVLEYLATYCYKDENDKLVLSSAVKDLSLLNYVYRTYAGRAGTAYLSIMSGDAWDKALKMVSPRGMTEWTINQKMNYYRLFCFEDEVKVDFHQVSDDIFNFKGFGESLASFRVNNLDEWNLFRTKLKVMRNNYFPE